MLLIITLNTSAPRVWACGCKLSGRVLLDATRALTPQERIAKAHGSQCGFCTPGIVMSMYALLRNHPEPTSRQVRPLLS